MRVEHVDGEDELVTLDSEEEAEAVSQPVYGIGLWRTTRT